MIKRYLAIPATLLKKRFFLLFIMTLVVALLSGSFAAASSAESKEGGALKISIGLVFTDRDSTAGLLLEEALKNPDAFPNVSLFYIDSEEEARQQVHDGSISAALLLPQDLMAWVNGEAEDGPVLLVNSVSSLEYSVFTTLGNSFLRMLSVAQRGVSLVSQAFRIADPTHVNYRTVWMGINLAYFSMAFDQMNRFHDVEVSGPDTLSFSVHSTLCICFAFCLLMSPALYDRLSLETNAPWIRRMTSLGHSPWQTSLGLLAVCWIGFAALLCILLALLSAGLAITGEHISISPLLLPSLIVSAAFLALYTFVLANVGSSLMGGLLSCLIGILGLLTAGGLIPRILLPAALQNLSAYSPVLWLRNVFAGSLFDMKTGSGLSFLALTAACAGLFLCSAALCRWHGRAEK